MTRCPSPCASLIEDCSSRYLTVYLRTIVNKFGTSCKDCQVFMARMLTILRNPTKLSLNPIGDVRYQRGSIQGADLCLGPPTFGNTCQPLNRLRRRG